MTIEEIKSGDSLQLNVSGRIDTFSADEFQNTILKAFNKSNKVIINLDQTEHISSIGLRALILGQKLAENKGGSLIVINPNEAVRDVFRVTGFEKVLEIR